MPHHPVVAADGILIVAKLLETLQEIDPTNLEPLDDHPVQAVLPHRSVAEPPFQLARVVT